MKEVQGQHGAGGCWLPSLPSQLCWFSPRPNLLGLGLSAAPQFCSPAGGGVMGAAGRNAARVALEDFRHL